MGCTGEEAEDVIDNYDGVGIKKPRTIDGRMDVTEAEIEAEAGADAAPRDLAASTIAIGARAPAASSSLLSSSSSSSSLFPSAAEVVPSSHLSIARQIEVDSHTHVYI